VCVAVGFNGEPHIAPLDYHGVVAVEGGQDLPAESKEREPLAVLPPLTEQGNLLGFGQSHWLTPFYEWCAYG